MSAEGEERRRVNVAGVFVDATTYAKATERVIKAAAEGRPFAGTALAVHGVMTGALDPEHRYRLNQLDMVTPDGQPVRWAMNLLHGTGLSDRVYGPTLTLHICERAAREGIGVFFYGSKQETLEKLRTNLEARFPNLKVAGCAPSRFRQLSGEEADEVAAMLNGSKAGIVFVGLGCPRQEVFAYEMRNRVKKPMLAVGAAFDFHAGTAKQAPPAMQAKGLEWLYRLVRDPRRLWKRYVILNPLYMLLVALQKVGLRKTRPSSSRRPETELLYG